MEGFKTLNDLAPGEKGLLVDIDAPAPLKQRFIDLGIIEGATLELIKTAPLGDPVEIKVNRTLYALRKSEAESLIIETTGDNNNGEKRHRYRFGR
jgi:ferrous iron transport protein A